MNGELPDGGFSIESLGEDPAANARHQLSLLERSLGTAREPAETASLLDEAFRAAHSLKSAIDASRMPNVDRLARRLQDVVRATRSGVLAVTPELGSMLASVARIARDALDAVSAGSAEPSSAATAAATLEEILAHPGAWTVPASSTGAPMLWARVEASRLNMAGEAAGEARAAAAAYSRAARELVDISERLLSGLGVHDEALGKLRDALPSELGRVARGEPTTAVAAELADMVSSLAFTASYLEQSLSRSSAAVQEAAILGARSAEKAENAFSSLRSVRLDALLEDLPRIVHRAARSAGTVVELVQEPTNLDVHASRAETVRAVVKTCTRILAGTKTARGRHHRRNAPLRGARLSIFARAAGESLHVRLALSVGAPAADQLKASLAAAERRLSREDGILEVESRKGESASVLLTLRHAAAITSRSAEFVFARAGDAWYAILASAVVECIEAGMAMSGVPARRHPSSHPADERHPRSEAGSRRADPAGRRCPAVRRGRRARGRTGDDRRRRCGTHGGHLRQRPQAGRHPRPPGGPGGPPPDELIPRATGDGAVRALFPHAVPS